MSTNTLITLLLVLVTLLYLLIIGVILRRQGFRKKVIPLVLVYVGLSLGWTIAQGLTFFTIFPTDILVRVTLYGLLILALIFFQLNWAFLRYGGPNWPWWALGVVWIAATIAVNELLLPLPATLANMPPQELGVWLVRVGWGVAMGGAIILAGRSYWQTHQPLHRNRLRYWMLALLLTLSSGVLFFMDYLALSSTFQLLGILLITYVVLTHNLIDIRYMVRRTISYLIMTLLTVIIYTAGFWLVQYLFQSLPNYNPIWAGAAVALLLSIFFNPLLKVVQGFVKGLITGASHDAGRIVGEYSASISNILDLKRLGTITLTFISRAIGIERAILYVVDTNMNDPETDPFDTATQEFHLRGVMGSGKGLPPGKVLPEGVLSTVSPVGNYLSHEDKSLTQYDIDLLPDFAETSAEERAWLTSLNMVVYVPIRIKERWIGLFAFGPKNSGDRYFGADLALLRTLADQTAIAFENARLFDDLKVHTEKIEHLNLELSTANRKLALLDQAKSDFIGVASHELRTPLTQVRGFNDILNDMASTNDLTPEMAVQMTNSINKSAIRLQTIVDTMFDVSLIDTKSLDLNASPNSLASIIKGVNAELASALDERKLTLTVEDLSELPFITADGQRIKQIFSNLMQNAIKYTPDGGQIRVTGRLLDKEKPEPEQSVEIMIRDTGIGISAKDLERLFEKFYRVGDVALHSTGATKFKGAGPGLGLTVARGLVEAHGGRLWAESPGYDEKNCPGSTFHVVLPVNPGPLYVEIV